MNMAIQQSFPLQMFLMALGAVVLISAAIKALAQHKVLKILFYHAASQAGYVLLGIATGIPVGIGGGLFHLINSAICLACLFLTATGTKYRTPITFISSVIAGLSMSGLPPFNGFFSIWMICQGLIQLLANPSGRFTIFLCLVAAVFTSTVTFVSIARLLHEVFLKQPPQEILEKKPKAVIWLVSLSALTLSLLCIIFGVFAHDLPLSYFIYPLVGQIPIIGSYAPGVLAGLFVLGMALAFIVYRANGIKIESEEDK